MEEQGENDGNNNPQGAAQKLEEILKIIPSQAIMMIKKNYHDRRGSCTQHCELHLALIRFEVKEAGDFLTP